MTDLTSADTYGIVVPVEWTEVPLEKSAFDTYCQLVLDELRKADGWTKTAERRVELLFTQIRNDLLRGRARMVAALAESSSDENGELVLLVAACAVSKLPATELLPSGRPLTVDQMHAALSRQRIENEDEHITDVEPPTRVDLDAGAAVRLKRLHTQHIAPGQDLRYYAQSYLVPHDDGRALCVVQFSTPCLEEAGALDELFDAIARTLRIFHPEDPTDFEGAPSEARV